MRFAEVERIMVDKPKTAPKQVAPPLNKPNVAKTAPAKPAVSKPTSGSRNH